MLTWLVEMVGWLVGLLVGWLAAGWFVCQLVDWLVGRSVSRLFGRSAGWSVC